MIRQFYDFQRRNASVAVTANWSAPTVSSGLKAKKPCSSMQIPAWSAAPAPKTARQTPSMLIRMMAAAAQPISLTAGSPDFEGRLHPDAAAEFPANTSNALFQNGDSSCGVQEKIGPKDICQASCSGKPSTVGYTHTHHPHSF